MHTFFQFLTPEQLRDWVRASLLLRSGPGGWHIIQHLVARRSLNIFRSALKKTMRRNRYADCASYLASHARGEGGWRPATLIIRQT
jgi:hypothetical protein